MKTLRGICFICPNKREFYPFGQMLLTKRGLINMDCILGIKNDVFIGFVGAILGAIIGGIFSYFGSIRATNKNIESTKAINEENERTSIKKSARNLITNIDIVCRMVADLNSAKGNMPPEIQGMIPTVEHRIGPIQWFSDLSVLSTKLNEEEYNKLVNFFIGVSRCDDVLERVWELRAAGQNFGLQLISFWNMLPSLLDDKDEIIGILRKLLK